MRRKWANRREKRAAALRWRWLPKPKCAPPTRHDDDPVVEAPVHEGGGVGTPTAQT